MKSIAAQTRIGGSGKDNRVGFKVDVSAEVTEEQYTKLAVLGLKQVVNSAGARVCKALDLKAVSELEYSADTATKLVKLLEKYADSTDNPIKSAFTAVFTASEHVPTNAAGWAEEESVALRHEQANDLEAWLKDKCGYSGPTHDDDKEYAVEMLRAIRAYKVKMMAMM